MAAARGIGLHAAPRSWTADWRRGGTRSSTPAWTARTRPRGPGSPPSARTSAARRGSAETLTRPRPWPRPASHRRRPACRGSRRPEARSRLLPRSGKGAKLLAREEPCPLEIEAVMRPAGPSAEGARAAPGSWCWPLVVGLALGASSLLAWYVDAAVVRLARLLRRLLEDARAEVHALLRRSRSSPSSSSTPRCACCSRLSWTRPSTACSTSTGSPSRCRSAPSSACVTWAVALVVGSRRRLRHDVRVDDVRPVPARARRGRGRRADRPDLRAAAGVLPLHAARLAARWPPG